MGTRLWVQYDRYGYSILIFNKYPGMKFYSLRPGTKFTCKHKFCYPRTSVIPRWDLISVTCKHALTLGNDLNRVLIKINKTTGLLLKIEKTLPRQALIYKARYNYISNLCKTTARLWCYFYDHGVIIQAGITCKKIALQKSIEFDMPLK